MSIAKWAQKDVPLVTGLDEGLDECWPAFRPLAEPVDAVTIRAADGDCAAYVFRPEGKGPWPAVLLLMDGFGMRASLQEMAQRLSDAGYLVLLPDLFYRRGPYVPLDVPKIFAGGNLREDVFAALGASPSIPMISADARFYLDFLDGHEDFAGGAIGVTGYCMSGGMSLAIAGTYPDRIAAAACFHGGFLVSESEASPHRFADSTMAEIYVGGAHVDEWCPPEMVAQLDAALASAGVKHRCEIYKDTLHGWTMRDSALYNHSAAERHWEALFLLFRRALYRG